MNTGLNTSVAGKGYIMKLIGHKSTKKQIKIAMKSAEARNAALPHLLFAGVAGCGKTSMAKALAREYNVDFLPMPAKEFKDHAAVISILEKLNHDHYDAKGNRTGNIKPTVLFVDEIHRMPTVGEESLGIAMEDLRLASEDGGYYWVPHFTIIGATTDDGSLSKPFRERFKLRFVFDPYSEEEIEDILRLHVNINKEDFDIELTPLAAREIAKRGRGIPRISLTYLERARDMALSKGGKNLVTGSIVKETFDDLGINDIGMTKVEMKILKALYDAKIPIGLENLAIISNESQKALSASAEPFLIRLGFIMRGGRGRIITTKGKRYVESTGYEGKKKKVLIPEGYVRQ